MNFHGKDIKIFAVNANPRVAKQIFECLGLPMGKVMFPHSATAKFLYLCLSPSAVPTVSSFSQPATGQPEPDGTVDYDRCDEACFRSTHYGGYPIFWVRPARPQGKSPRPDFRQACGDLITTAGADRVLTMDLHAPQIQGFFNIPVDHLLGVPLLSSYIKERIKDPADYVAVSPTLALLPAPVTCGAPCCPLAIVDKRRQKANVCEVMNIIGDVKGKKIVLVDDMIDTAGTFCNAAQAIMDAGAKGNHRVCQRTRFCPTRCGTP